MAYVFAQRSEGCEFESHLDLTQGCNLRLGKKYIIYWLTYTLYRPWGLQSKKLTTTHVYWHHWSMKVHLYFFSLPHLTRTLLSLEDSHCWKSISKAGSTSVENASFFTLGSGAFSIFAMYSRIASQNFDRAEKGNECLFDDTCIVMIYLNNWYIVP